MDVCVCFILSVKVMWGQTLNTQLQVSQFDAFTELFCSNCKCEGLSATRVQPHTLCQYLPVGVNGSTTWQRAACLTWWNLQDHPLVRANKARDLPALRDVFPHASTCFQTLVRKCPCTLTKARGSTSTGSGNWMQLGPFSMFGEVKKELEETSVKHQNGCSSHLLAAGRLIKKKEKNLTQTRREDHFSRLIKQSVYDDSCRTDANTLRQKCDVKSLKWDFWQQRSGRTEEK